MAWRPAHVGLAGAALLAATACGQVSGGAAAGSVAAGPPCLASSVTPSSAVEQGYVVPAPTPAQDGALFLRRVQGRAVGAPMPLGLGTSLTVLDAGGAGRAARVQVSARDGLRQLSVGSRADVPGPQAFAPGDGAIYVETATGVERRDAAGTRAFPRPAVPEGWVAGVVDGRPVKANVPAQLRLSAVTCQDGGALAVWTDQAGAVLAPLLGQAPAVSVRGAGAVLAAQGHGSVVDLLAADPTTSAAPIRLLQVDLNSGAVASDTPAGPSLTGRTASAGFIKQDGAAWALLATSADSGDAPVADVLVRVGSDHAVTTQALPDGTGLRLAAGAGGTAYVFGGPAGNQVRSLDLAAGTLATVAAWATPAGSYVTDLVPAAS